MARFHSDQSIRTHGGVCGTSRVGYAPVAPALLRVYVEPQVAPVATTSQREGFEDHLSSIGGLAGLFTGASILGIARCLIRAARAGTNRWGQMSRLQMTMAGKGP